MLIGGETLDAAAALRCGLASRLGDRESGPGLGPRAAGLAPLSLAYAKKALNQETEHEPDSAELVKDFEACWASEDAARGPARPRRQAPARFLGS